MGVWGHGFFDNDNAGDWVYELECRHDLAFVEETLDRALRADYRPLEFWEGEEALAAVEAVARLKGNWGLRNAGTRPLDVWVESADVELTPTVIEKARAALERVASNSSHLARIWEGTGWFESWQTNIADLRRRISE